MNKNELRKTRTLNATREMMEKGRKTTTEMKVVSWYPKREEKEVEIPEYEFLVRAKWTTKMGVIKFAVFFPEKMKKGIKTPRYEIFINKKGNEYITRVLDDEGKEEGWSGAMVGNLPDIRFGGRKIYLTNDTARTLVGLCEEGKGLERLQKWQENIRKNKIIEKEKRQQEPWDKDMELVSKELPEKFVEWTRRHGTEECFIFYEYRQKEAETGFCSKCKNTVKIIKPKHGARTRCPICREKAVFKSSGKIKNLRTEYYRVEMIQKIENGIVIKLFNCYQSYKGKKYTEPDLMASEEVRTLVFNDGTIREYAKILYKNKYMRFCPQGSDGNYYWSGTKAKLWKGNGKEIEKAGTLKYSGYGNWPELPRRLGKYLMEEKRRPVIEMLSKIGMLELAEEFVNRNGRLEIDENKTNLHEILKLDKGRFRRLREMKGGIEHTIWLRQEKAEDTLYPSGMIEELAGEGITHSDLRFIKDRYTYSNAWRYIKKQAEISGDSMRQTVITWRDYYDMAKKEKYNVESDILAKPKDLKLEHDKLIKAIATRGIEAETEKLEKKFPRVNENLEALKKFEYAADGFAIVAPKKMYDIVEEGTCLRHCIHTCDYYFDRIQRRETYLLFLRKEKTPDIPWYTLEVELNGNIRQKRTTGDTQNEDLKTAIKFLGKWQKFMKKLLTEEEKELGKKANELRIQEYKEMREQDKRVWHGKLAGKLLADVLEDDLLLAE